MVKVDNLIRPLNRGFSALSVKSIIQDLTLRYYKNIQKDIKIRVIKEKNTYYVFAKVPSEGNENYPGELIFYDVILELIPPNMAMTHNPSVRDYDVKLFANIPSFVYTFNHVFFAKRGLIDMPSGYYNTRTVKEKAKMRNPLNLLGIDKAVWFTVFHLDLIKFFKRENIDAGCEDNVTFKQILKDVKTQDKKFDEVEDRIHKHAHQEKKKSNEKFSEAEIASLKHKQRSETRQAGHAVNKSETDQFAGVNRNTLHTDLTSGLSSSMSANSLSVKTHGKDISKIVDDHEKAKGGLHSNMQSNLGASLRRKK